MCGGRRDTLILLELVFMAASLLVCLATVLVTLCSQVSHGSRVIRRVSRDTCLMSRVSTLSQKISNEVEVHQPVTQKESLLSCYPTESAIELS